MMTTEEAYKKGFLDAMECWAWWKNGELYLGMCGTKLKHAIEDRALAANSFYRPPVESDQVK